MGSMNKFILASFCNIPTPTGSPVIGIELPLNKNSRVLPINIGSEHPVNTATGLCVGEGRIFVSYLAKGKFCISSINEKSLEIEFNHEFPSSKDTHSMIVSGGYLYTVSTGTDEVIRYEITKTGLKKSEFIWKASDGKKENHHINSICEFDGDIIVSGFGKGEMDNAWRTAKDGFIFNISKGVFIKTGIYQPHSASSGGGSIFYCESGYGKFIHSKSIVLDGYTRGVTMLNGGAFVGTSIGRAKNKKSSEIFNPSDYGKRKGICAIHEINTKTNKVISKFDLGWFASEIYDLAILKISDNALFEMSKKSFLEERNLLSKEISKNQRFWSFVKDSIK